jgi:hypothetical protein
MCKTWFERLLCWLLGCCPDETRTVENETNQNTKE